jgi:hypothetical protein
LRVPKKLSIGALAIHVVLSISPGIPVQGIGSSYGARAAGMEVVCGVDAWSCTTEVHAANFRRAKAVTLIAATQFKGLYDGDRSQIEVYCLMTFAEESLISRHGSHPIRL